MRDKEGRKLSVCVLKKHNSAHSEREKREEWEGLNKYVGGRDNRLMENMRPHPLNPRCPPLFCGFAFDPPSPLKPASSPRSITCHLSPRSFSLPPCIYVRLRVPFIKACISAPCIVFHSSSNSFTRCQIRTPPAALALFFILSKP